MKSTLKKFLSITLVVSMLMSMCTFAFATFDDQVMKGYYVLDENGNVTGTTTTSTFEQDGYKLDKTIQQTGENAFNVTLKVETSQTVTTTDAAVQLLIDVSGSMDDCANCGRDDYHSSDCPKYVWNDSSVKSSQTRMKAVIDTLTKDGGFIDTLAAGGNGGKVYVCVLQFSGFSQADAKCVKEWVDVTNDTNKEAVKTAISELYAKGGTNLEAGLILAGNRLNMRDISSVAANNKYTVLLTDGKPTARCSKSHTGETSSIVDYNEDDNGSATSQKERNEAVTAATAVKAGSKLYAIYYGQGDENLYSVTACEHCGKTQNEHNKVTTGSGWNRTTTYYCSGNSGNTYKAKTTTVSVFDYIEDEIATPASADATYAYNASNEADVNEAFAAVASSTVDGMSGAGTAVTDPMGDFVVMGSVASLDGVTAAGNGLNWNLDPSKATKTTSADGKTTTYVYQITYPITLNTSAEGFQEKNADGSIKYYPTNGYTYLEVPQEGAAAKKIAFNVPGVKGEIPEYPYTIEYYKQDTAEAGDYEHYTKVKTTDGEKTDLHTTISLADKDAEYETKYAEDNYHFAKATTTITITADKAQNVIKVYYDKDTTNVTVNHFYKLTTVNKDGTTTVRDWPKTADDTTTDSGYVGESYTAQEKNTWGGVAYDLSKESNNKTIKLAKSADKNVINLYYEQEQDLRDPASVVVDHVYRLHTWTLNPQTGKYELVDEKPVTEPKVEEANNLKESQKYTATNAPKTGYEGYEAAAENEAAKTVTLKPRENKITLYFDKTVDGRVPANVTVIHHYTKNVTEVKDGEVVNSTPVNDKTKTAAPVSMYVGETFTVSEDNTFENENYTSDSGNAAKLSGTVAAGGNTIDLYYTLVEKPATTTVTVNHYYRTTTTTTVFNQETNEYEDKTETTTEHGENDVVVSETLYVGESYTASTEYKPGFEFTSAEPDRTVNAAANNASVINLYYDKAKDGRTDASINAKHIYTTHLTTIVAGEVKTIDVRDGEQLDTQQKGKVGDSYRFSTITSFKGNDDYCVVGMPVLSGTLKVPDENPDVVINYERSASDLVPTTYTVDYNYKTYTMFVDTDGVAKYPTTPAVETDDPVNGIGYVNQKVTITDGAKGDFTAEGTNPATEQILKASGNEYTFNYVKYVPLGTGSVQVNHHYTTTTIAVDGSSSSTGFDRAGVSTEKYVGETYAAAAEPNGYRLDSVTVDTAAAEAGRSVSVTVKDGVTVIDFYYSKTVDNSQPVDYSITHIYKTIDWDGTVTESRPDPITGESFATKQLSAATDNRKGDFSLVEATFNGETIDGFDEADPQDTYAVILVNGENEIVYTYEKHIDTRDDKDVSVKVIHNYFKRDTYTTDEALSNEDFIKDAAAEYVTEMNVVGKDNGIWIGNSYTAEKVLSYTVGEGDEAKTLTYEFVNADPESMKVELTKAGEYVITINYLREYSTDPGDTSYVVKHTYYRNGTLEAEVTTNEIVGKVGTVVNASDIEKITTNDGRNYRFTSATPDTITLAADELGVITLRYDRTTGGGGGGTTPTPENPVTPPEDIDEPDVPLAGDPEIEDLGDSDVPLAGLPGDELEDLEEEEVPLAAVPKTSDMALFWLASSALSGIGLGALNLKKREDEDEQ